MSPIFVVGVGRSGTTLLVNLLGCHPLLSPIYETAFLRNLLMLCESASWFWGNSPSRRLGALIPGYPQRFLLSRCEKYRKKCEEFRSFIRSLPPPAERREQGVRQKYEVFPFENQALLFNMDELIKEMEAFLQVLVAGPRNEVEIYALARSAIDRQFSEHCARAQKAHWVNKTPRLLLSLDLLPKLYPGAKCIHIVRDGRDVAASFRTLSWGPRDVRQAARRWRDRLSQRKRFDSRRLSYLEVHYEDLIKAPSEKLEMIMRFLELEGSTEDVVGRLPIYNYRVGAWRTAFSLNERKAFDQEAGELLIELGYEKDHSWICRP
ncbi:MAG: sulfotransferase family protein [Candidatus Binatia bacterium]